MTTNSLYEMELEWTQDAFDRVETIINSGDVNWVRVYAILKTRLEGLALAVSIIEDLPKIGQYKN